MPPGKPIAQLQYVDFLNLIPICYIAHVLSASLNAVKGYQNVLVMANKSKKA